ncbi:MAG TPA: carbohydrate ABC transporter permease [Aggregatilineales bacterium]|nr:carbohydrate ABC transporter permease [Aggregatilineales bacterium]
MVTSRATRIFDAISTHVVLGLFALLFVFPVAYALMTSFKTRGEVLTTPPTFFPSQVTLEGYQTLFFGSNGFSRPNLIPYQLPNTFINSFFSSILTIVIAALAGYTFSRYKFRGSHALQLAILGLIMIPGLTNLVPLFRIASDLHVTSTHEFIIAVYTAGGLPFTIWIVKTFFDTIPQEIEEAALIDGCNPFQALRYVLIPLAMPGLAAAFLLMFVDTWNEFLAALVLLGNDRMKTATVGLYDFQSSFETAYHVWAAACIIIMVPVLVIFLLLRKTFFEAMLQGAIKG